MATVKPRYQNWAIHLFSGGGDDDRKSELHNHAVVTVVTAATAVRGIIDVHASEGMGTHAARYVKTRLFKGATASTGSARPIPQHHIANIRSRQIQRTKRLPRSRPQGKVRFIKSNHAKTLHALFAKRISIPPCG